MRLVKWFSTAFLVVVSIVGCANFSANVFARNPDLPTIEVVYFDQSFPSFLVYKAELRAPRGTKVNVHEGTITIGNEPYDFTLSHHMYYEPLSADAGVKTQYFSTNSYITSVFITIPGSGTVDLENVDMHDYAEFSRPGIYTLEENETFTLAKIEDNSYTVTIVDIPDD